MLLYSVSFPCGPRKKMSLRSKKETNKQQEKWLDPSGKIGAQYYVKKEDITEG